MFGDARLDDLESHLVAANPALAEAEARFSQAQALVRERRAQYFPAATAAAQRSLDISMNQYRAGTTSYLQVSTEQTALLTSQRTAVSVTERQFVAAVQLVRALGGGWNR